MRRMSMLSVLFLAGWFLASPAAPSGEPTAILVAAAASLQYSYANALIPDFQKKYPWITVEGTYDSSGKLQAQIENGLAADVFMSAAMKQMNELVGKGFIDAGSVVELLENRIVLIRPAAAGTDIAGFADAVKAKVIALGDPKSVPAGQYAREVFTSLGLWDRIEAKASFGTNVTEVLNWVAEGSADLGVVYATDAAVTGKVAVIAEAPAGSLKARVIYPVGISRNGERKEAAKLFVDYLRSEEALAVFARYGFSPNRGD